MKRGVSTGCSEHCNQTSLDINVEKTKRIHFAKMELSSIE